MKLTRDKGGESSRKGSWIATGRGSSLALARSTKVVSQHAMTGGFLLHKCSSFLGHWRLHLEADVVLRVMQGGFESERCSRESRSGRHKVGADRLSFCRQGGILVAGRFVLHGSACGRFMRRFAPTRRVTKRSATGTIRKCDTDQVISLNSGGYKSVCIPAGP